jgi:O-antigen ligase
MAWIIAVAGMMAYASLRGGRDGIAVLFTLFLCGAIFCFAVQFLPHADTIIERASTFGDLANDDSYNGRKFTTQAMLDEIIDRPWGRGMGFKTAGKLSGQSTMVTPIDNGYGDLVWTLGLLGGAAYLAGIAHISVSLFRRSAFRAGSTLRLIRLLAGTVLLMLMLANCAALSMLGITGVWLWFYVGLASAPLPRRERAAAPAF